jgi:hydroxypyruvate isomerase
MSRSKYTVNCSIIFTELPILQRPLAAATAGFSAVEFWWPFPVANPERHDVDEFIVAIRDAGVSLSGLNFFAGDMSAGERGILSSTARESEFTQNVEVVRYIAEQTGCRIFNALYGVRLPEETPEAQDATALRRLSELASFTSETNSVILIEPLSAMDTYPLKTARQAVDVIENLGVRGATTNVKLLLDVYHLAVNGDDVSADIAEFASVIAHVQVADAPGRNEPGTGDLPIQRWFDELGAVGYSGLFGLEYRPSASSQSSFDWIADEAHG